MKRFIPKYEENIAITEENIDAILEKISGMKSSKQKSTLVALQGGRDPITKEKMEEGTKSTALKMKNELIVISNKNNDRAKKFTPEQRLNAQKSHIIAINRFNRGLSNGEE